jgi:hypothetical protein
MIPHDKTNPYISDFQGVPPSKLGFVCKPDMPPHINILFRARPPLEFVENSKKGKCRSYEGLLKYGNNLLDRFEKNPPEKHIPDETKRINRLKSMIEKIEEHKLDNKDKIKECKYFNMRYLGKRYFSRFFLF